MQCNTIHNTTIYKTIQKHYNPNREKRNETECKQIKQKANQMKWNQLHNTIHYTTAYNTIQYYKHYNQNTENPKEAERNETKAKPNETRPNQIKPTL